MHVFWLLCCKYPCSPPQFSVILMLLSSAAGNKRCVTAKIMPAKKAVVKLGRKNNCVTFFSISGCALVLKK